VTDHLFPIASDDIKVTSDDCYTPPWVFDAMGLEFDLDVAAPPGGPWHVPAKRYYTAEDDGLTSPWDGLVWCNPPYSSFAVWANRWLVHDRGVLMGMVMPQTRWDEASREWLRRTRPMWRRNRQRPRRIHSPGRQHDATT